MCWLVTAKRVATSLTRSACFRPSKISTSLIALLSSKNRKPHDPSRFGPFSQIRRAANPHQLRRTDVAMVAGGISAGHSFGELFIPQGVPPQDLSFLRAARLPDSTSL